MRYTDQDYRRAAAILLNERNACTPPTPMQRMHLHEMLGAYLLKIDVEPDPYRERRRLLDDLDPARAADLPLIR